MSDQNNLPEGFKMTELGLLPEDWEVVRMDNAAGISMGQSPPSSTYNSEGKGLPFFQGKADFGDVHPVARKWCSTPAKIAEKNDILLSVRAPIGDVNIAEERSCFGRGLAAIRANHKTEGKYLFYRLIFSKELLESKGTGTTFKEINKASVVNFILPLPPLPEQKAIARVLSTIQKVIEIQDKIIAAARELKKSLMRHLFTYGPVPVAEAEKVPLKETEIGPVPEHWEVMSLGELASLVGSGLTPRGGRKTYVKNGIPFIREQNVQMNRLSLEDIAFISHEVHHSMGRSVVKTGDVLLNITGASIGRVTHVPRTMSVANVNQHVCRIRLGTGIAPEFVSYFLSSSMGQFQIMGTQFGTTRQGLNYGQVKSLQIPLPPRFEQQEIAHMLSAVDKKIQVEENRKAALQALFKTMLHHLITGKVRVREAVAKGRI